MGGELQRLRETIERRDRELERFYKQSDERFGFINGILKKQANNDNVISEAVMKVHEDVARIRIVFN